MIAHSSGFKEAFTKLGREVYVKINHYSMIYNLKTEDNKLILTEDNMHLLSEIMEKSVPDQELTNDDIYLLSKNNLGELFRTYMKSFDLETTQEFNIGSKMIVQIGTKVGEDIEYLNYGKYYVYSKEYNEDSKTYKYTICDRMLFTMIPYDNDAVFEDNDTLTCQEVVNQILTLCDIPYALSTLINGDKDINKGTFDGLEMTYRDVLDMIMQSQGCSLVVDYDAENDIDRIIDKSFNSSVVDTIDENILSDKNIKINEKFGKINSLLLKRASGNDNLERKDQEAIDKDGLCQYAIENNLILDQDNREEYIDNLFNKIKDIEYYTCEFDTIGIGYIEYMDLFAISTPDSIHNCLCLKNTMEIKSGVKETFTTEMPQEKAKEYESGGMSDKDAKILVDKLKGEIVLKTYQDGDKTKIAQVRLDSSGDEGSLVEISGDQIDLTGKDINLTGDNITISSTKFNVDKNGNLTCNDATMSHATMNNAILNNGYMIVKNASYDTAIIQIEGLENPDTGTHYTTDIFSDAYNVWGNNDNIYLGQHSYNKWGLRVSKYNTGYCDYNYDGQHPSSDRRCKENINNIKKEQSLNIITNLQPVEFNYIEIEDKHRGLIAQDVKEVLNKNGIDNQVYGYDKEKDRYTLNYTELIPDLINCIKYQQEQIEELKEEINKLKEVK